jgi:hypothetical protein
LVARDRTVERGLPRSLLQRRGNDPEKGQRKAQMARAQPAADVVPRPRWGIGNLLAFFFFTHPRT